ncbi:MAG: choice-of-anchor tandem repeat GloVer-containing protein [Candidatus Korobacteraceae bacterium]
MHTFTGDDGYLAYGGVIKDQAGNLYGATTQGGTHNENGGVVYELSPSGPGWTFQVIYNLPGIVGPYGALTLDAAGNLYGIGQGDGAHDLGMLFKLTPSNGSWTFTDLFDFSGANGCLPYGSVTLDPSGNIFGTTEGCGLYGYGEVWEFTP